MTTPEFKVGGYPVNWFVKPPSTNFKCGICLDILKNPHQCKNGHNFCHSCISQALEVHRECPTCKTALKLSTLCINLPLRNIIDEMLDVKCNFENNNNDDDEEDFEGCEWTGTLEQSFDHFKTCPKHLIHCPLHEMKFCMNVDCTGKIQRQDLSDHLFFDNSKRDISDTMLTMAQTIAYQKKEIELLHDLCLNKEAKHMAYQGGAVFYGVDEKKDGVIDFGLIKYTDGSTHIGEFKNGAYHGFGVNRTATDVYAGEWRNNQQHGHGVQRWLQNSAFMNTYIGDFKNNRKNGVGTFVGICDTDVGCFENDIFHGKGTRTNSNGHNYEGIFDSDIPSSTIPGVLTLDEDATFIGTITNEQKFIKGKYTTFNGIEFEGDFADGADEDNINGTGTITVNNGFIYKGDFKGGDMHGKGTCSFPNGDFLDGMFVSGEDCASVCTGTLTFYCGSVFVGSLKRQTRNKFGFVEGKFTNFDGIVYEGMFADNSNNMILNGTGTVTYTDGMVYTGEFEHGDRHGEGTCVFPNGDILKGTFNEHRGPSISGTLTMHDGSTYVGTMNLCENTNKYEFCIGKLTTNDGVVYEGEFEDNYGGGNDVNGTGTITYTDGTVHTGEFKNGLRVEQENGSTLSNSENVCSV